MTVTELNTLIDTEITNASDDNSITPAIVGGRIKDAVATVIGALKPYKQLLFLFTIEGGVPSATYLINDFGEVTLTIPSNGQLKVEVPDGQFTVRTKLMTGIVMQGDTPYRLVPTSTWMPLAVEVNIQEWDGTQTSTPSIANQIIEIRTYN